VGSRVKHGIDALADFRHTVGIFDFASNDLEVWVLELEWRVANEGPNRVALVEKASNQMAAKETGGPGDQTGPEVIEWLCG
jgi:hypothetical protein